MKKFIISFISILSVLQSTNPAVYAEEKKLNISPIVQVISYYDVYGKYPRMMGWGSASIVNNQGVIISNDHVVDNGRGALASAFSICITKNINEKPSCDYTASLIARDDKLDVSMLRIDGTDIYGNKVDYSHFKSIEIDYDYVPKTQDETIAIGYPWIGADTISETKGIVSGLSDYNGYKYIKTDTLIAGGNSGGAFVNMAGKLIGIPTFGIGFGDSMGYALSIKEAKSFIEENIDTPATKSTVTEIIDFNGYRKTIENINAKIHLKDDIFDIAFPKDYEILNYEKNKSLEIGLRKQKDTGVNFLSLYVERAPVLDTQRKMFYYLESIGFYSKNWQKLQKKNIGGIDFYYPVDKTDLSDGDSSWGKSYKAVLGGYIISLELQAPLYDEKRNKEVKKEIENLFVGIKINKENVVKSTNVFSTNIPKIDITSFKNNIADTGRYKFYIGTHLYEYVDINLNELIEYNGKGKTLDEIYDIQLKDVDISEKAKITFKGLDGYITCSENITPYYYYNYYGNYGYGNTNTDEYGNPVETKSCKINIYFPLNKELNRQNYLSIELRSETAKIEENLNKLIKFLSKNVTVYSDDTEVNIPNLFTNQIKLQFTDLGKQSTAYKNFLKLLIRYGAIKNTETFDGSRPLQWGEYLDMYTKWIYNFDTKNNICSEREYSCKFENYLVDINGKKISLHSLFLDMGIDYNEYVDSSRIYEFEKLFQYELAGVDIGEMNEENLYLFENMSSEKEYVNEQKKLNDLNSRTYGVKKILLSDFYSNYSTTFNSNRDNRFYITENKLKQVERFDTKKISLSNKQNDSFNLQIALKKLDQNFDCTKKTNYSAFSKCYNNLKIRLKAIHNKYERVLNMNSYYIVFSKAEALEQIFSQVDFGLFDVELAKKKDTVIEDTSKNDPQNDAVK